MQKAVLFHCYAECHYTECHYTECHYTECHYTECHYTECNSRKWREKINKLQQLHPKNGATTFSITTLSIMTPIIATFSILTTSIMTLCIKISSFLLSVLYAESRIISLLCWVSLYRVSLCWVSGAMIHSIMTFSIHVQLSTLQKTRCLFHETNYGPNLTL